MTDDDIRGFLETMASETDLSSVAPALVIRRARRRLARTIALGALAITLAVIGGVAGVRSLTAAPAPVVHPGPTVSSSTPRLPHNGLIAVANGNGIVTFDPVTGTLHTLVRCPGVCRDYSQSGQTSSPTCPGVCTYIRSLAWSPDGTKIAYFQSYGVNDMLIVRDVRTGVSRRLTCGIQNHYACGLGEGAPLSWSPDGSRLAFGMHAAVYTIDVSGKHLTRLVTGYRPQWSPDGSRILFEQIVGAANIIYAMDAKGSHRTLLAEGNRPTWSPDGQRVLFDAGRAIYVVNVNGSHRTLLAAEGYAPAWSPDGTRMAFANYIGAGASRQVPKTLQFWVANSDGSSPTVIFQESGCCFGDLGGPTWSPDGTRLAVVLIGDSSRNIPLFQEARYRLMLMDADGTHVKVLGTSYPFRPAWRATL